MRAHFSCLHLQATHTFARKRREIVVPFLFRFIYMQLNGFTRKKNRRKKKSQHYTKKLGGKKKNGSKCKE